MTVMAGQAYARVEEPDLYQLLRHMKALTRVIGNYHRAGFLHLDIKPDNIFVYPETPEMLLLFDFDSVVPKDAVSSGTGLSYTRDWAAPEQLPDLRSDRPLFHWRDPLYEDLRPALGSCRPTFFFFL